MSIPKMRFHGYNSPWKVSKLGELFEIYSGNTPSRSDRNNYDNGTIPWIKTTDLNNSIICANEEKISVYGATKLKVLPEKSVLIAMYGGFNQIGRTGLLTYPATINQALASLLPVKEINSYFLLNYLNLRKDSWRNVAASSRKDPNITKNDVEKFKISFPSLEEQSAIGSLFRLLDDLLASYKDNLANYQSLKATMLAKMFPKAGQTVPEIRLDGFEGEWELLEINDLADDFQSGGTPKTNVQEYWDGEIPWIQSSDLETDCLFKIKVQKSISEKGLKKSSAKIIPKDSIAVVTRVGVGKLAVMRHEYATSQDFLSLSNLKSNIEFTAYLLYRLLQKEVTQLQGTSIKGITKVELLSKKVLIPSLSEQQAIGTYFSNLDNLIAAHQVKISQLETLKKKLLQDMFI